MWLVAPRSSPAFVGWLRPASFFCFPWENPDGKSQDAIPFRYKQL